MLARSPFYDWGGWWPAKTHGWTSTMIEYDGRHGTPFALEYGYSQRYQVNIQLRPGERLTRNCAGVSNWHEWALDLTRGEWKAS